MTVWNARRLRPLCLRLFSLGLVAGVPHQSLAQELLTLPSGTAFAIETAADGDDQALIAGDQTLLTAASIQGLMVLVGADGNPAGLMVQATSQIEGCPDSVYAVTEAFGTPWLQGPLGESCRPYVAASFPGGAILLSPAELYLNGDVVVFDTERGPFRAGSLQYAAQPGRGWDALDAEVGGYSDLSPLDLFAAEPVLEALQSGWGSELPLFARHLTERTPPTILGDFLVQTGCVPSQCEFAIGMLAVDPAQETVFAAYFSEGAPAAQPALDTWPEPARALYDRWRAGELRENPQ